MAKKILSMTEARRRAYASRSGTTKEYDAYMNSYWAFRSGMWRLSGGALGAFLAVSCGIRVGAEAGKILMGLGQGAIMGGIILMAGALLAMPANRRGRNLAQQAYDRLNPPAPVHPLYCPSGMGSNGTWC